MRKVRSLLFLPIFLLFFVPPYAADDGTIPPREDTAKPRFVSLSIFPDEIDNSDGIQWVFLVARFTDEGDGFGHADLRFRPVDGSYRGRNVIFNAENLVAGTLFDGYYASRLLVPQYAPEGEWILFFVYVDDRAGNYTLVQRTEAEPYMGYSFWNGLYAEGSKEELRVLFLPIVAKE